MKRIRIVRLPFLIPTWAHAQVVFPDTIFVRRDVKLTVDLIAHELEHIKQIDEMGLLRYWWVYLKGLIRHGYRRHPLEHDAWVITEEEERQALHYLSLWEQSHGVK